MTNWLLNCFNLANKTQPISLDCTKIWNQTKTSYLCDSCLWLFFLVAPKLFEQEAELDWVIFHDVMVTSRVYIRTVCPIRYEWVKDLLPKLHEVDVYELSSVARQEVTEEEVAKWETREAAKRPTGFTVIHQILLWESWSCVVKLSAAKRSLDKSIHPMGCLIKIGCPCVTSWTFYSVRSVTLFYTGKLIDKFVLLPEVSVEEVIKKMEKRNDETSVSDARARYLQRKQQRQQSKAPWKQNTSTTRVPNLGPLFRGYDWYARS